MVLENKYIY